MSEIFEKRVMPGIVCEQCVHFIQDLNCVRLRALRSEAERPRRMYRNRKCSEPLPGSIFVPGDGVAKRMKLMILHPDSVVMSGM